MTRVGQLREQARILRTLAGSFDIPSIKEQLLALAARCEDLAASIEKTLKENLSGPIDGAIKGRRPRSVLIPRD
jgi:hypothetical protein